MTTQSDKQTDNQPALQPPDLLPCPLSVKQNVEGTWDILINKSKPFPSLTFWSQGGAEEVVRLVHEAYTRASADGVVIVDEAERDRLLDALSDNPTEEEAETVLRACGTNGKKVINEFIVRLLRDRLAFENAIKTFIQDRGKHDGEHVFDLTVCSKCDESYIRAEETLDKMLSVSAATAPIAAPVERDNERDDDNV